MRKKSIKYLPWVLVVVLGLVLLGGYIRTDRAVAKASYEVQANKIEKYRITEPKGAKVTAIAMVTLTGMTEIAAGYDDGVVEFYRIPKEEMR